MRRRICDTVVATIVGPWITCATRVTDTFTGVTLTRASRRGFGVTAPRLRKVRRGSARVHVVSMRVANDLHAVARSARATPVAIGGCSRRCAAENLIQNAIVNPDAFGARRRF